MSNHKNRADFDRILEDVLKELPLFVRDQLKEIPLIVEDEPSPEILNLMGFPPNEMSDLCGLHSGVPLTERSVTVPSLDSPTILIFRGPITRLAGDDPVALREEILITVLHELGHHFGFSEEELEELGYG